MVKHLRRCPPSKVDLDQNEWKSKQVHPSRDQTESQEDPSIQITYEYVQLCCFMCARKASLLHFWRSLGNALGFLTLGKKKS